MKRPLIAIADDDAEFASYLQRFLGTLGYETVVYEHGEALLAAAHLGQLPEVVLLDVMMPGMDGIATLRSLKASHPDLQVIMLSGREQASVIVEALSLGAVNYVVKPGDPDGLGEIALEAALNQAMEKRQLVSEVTALRRRADDEQQNVFFWDSNPHMRHIGVLIDRVADSDVTVLIRGESGVGKEVVARAIHNQSLRRAKPFVKVNCAALPDELLESELFGHEKGAFTGAASMRIGKFEHADGGTLMLDEIGEMKPSLQGKLLHVLQDGEFSRLGGNKRVPADVRIIAATNRDLEAMLHRLEFREDLYYRLQVIEIIVPPLRERGDEIPQLARFFAAKYSRQYGRQDPVLSPTALEAMKHYPWPGNIRELENMMKRFVILQDEQHLIRDLQAPPRFSAAASEAPPQHETKAASNGDGGAKANGEDTKPADSVAAVIASGRQLSLAEAVDEAILRAERDVIVPTLRKVRWNRKKAAPLLGVSYKTLLNKIKKHGIVPD
ncbi:MAG TPA: sigma-54 dependent transcriptional regulator [Vicinamibacterales bacterium]|nr:sigma-54 dependent transcriptional regulator [Vicinamibacterales bacterium]